MKKRIARVDGIIWRKVGDEVAIIVMDDDNNSLHILNKTAAHIWEMCDGEHDADDIAASLNERFDVTLEKAKTDVNSTIAKLEKLNVIKYDQGGTE
jgi:methyltransferase-like protein